MVHRIEVCTVWAANIQWNQMESASTTKVIQRNITGQWLAHEKGIWQTALFLARAWNSHKTDDIWWLILTYHRHHPSTESPRHNWSGQPRAAGQGSRTEIPRLRFPSPPVWVDITSWLRQSRPFLELPGRGCHPNQDTNVEVDHPHMCTCVYMCAWHVYLCVSIYICVCVCVM